jgi:DNA-3-methyladenine glycosylase II
MLQQADEHLKRSDKVMATIIAKQGPCTLRPQRPYFFVLCDAIISQQVSVKAAATIVRRFRALYGMRRYPTTRQVLSTPDEQLTSAGVSRAKTGYIKDLAEHFHEGKIKYRRFHQLSDEEIINELVAVKGIGRWTAEMFLIFSLNRPDVLPVGDLGLQRAVQLRYQLDNSPTSTQLVEIAEPWRPYRTVATWHLWRSVTNP